MSRLDLDFRCEDVIVPYTVQLFERANEVKVAEAQSIILTLQVNLSDLSLGVKTALVVR